MLFVWVSPIVLFLVLVATGRVSALVSALLALALSAGVVIGVGPTAVTPAQYAGMAFAGAWIALPVVLVILAGLYFTEVLDSADFRLATGGAGQGLSARSLGTTCLFVGPFVETATGFGVGYVVAVVGVIRAGVGPAGALALGAFSQCLVPWGGLGIGTKISASLAGVPVDDLTWRIAIIVAPVLWIMVLVYWKIARAAGVEIDGAQRREDAGCVVALSIFLVAANQILPIELAGLAAIGPVLLYRMWRSDGADVFAAPAMRRGAPYVILIGLLAVTKLVPQVRDALSVFAFTPGQGAPAFAPLASAAIPMIFAAVLGCLAHGQWHGLTSSVSRAAQKGMRACLLTVLLVMLAWIIVRSGIAEAFAQDLRGWLGRQASLVVPILGSLGGYLTGSNTGAGSLAMPVAKSVAADGAVLRWIAAAAVMAGSVFTAFSPVRFAMGQAIANAGKADARWALRWLLPFALATVGVAVCAVGLANLLAR